MFIQTEHIYLRALEPSDLELLYACENNRDVWNVSNTITPFSKHILQQYLEASQNDIYTNKQ
jgi:diamine N-acetyltransferase